MPQTRPVESALAGMWESVLSTGPIGVHDVTGRMTLTDEVPHLYAQRRPENAGASDT